MKKISYVFILVLAFLTTFMVVDEFNKFYYYRIKNFCTVIQGQTDKKELGFFISPKSQEKTLQELLSQIEQVALDNEAEVVILKSIRKAGENVEYAYLYANDFKMTETLYLEKNIDISFTNKNEQGYYTTAKDDRNATDTIHLLSDEYSDGNIHPQLVVKPFNQYDDDWSEDGEEESLYVTFYSNDFNGMKDIIMKEFTSISSDSIGAFEKQPDNPIAMDISIKLIIMTIVILILLLTCEVNKNIKDISIRKMHGSSISQIISSIFGKFFIKGIFVFCIGILISYVGLVGEISPMAFNIIKSIFKIILLFTIFYILSTVIIYFFIKTLSVAINMKKRNIYYTLINMNLLIKLILMIIVINPFLTTVSSGIESVKLLVDINKYHDSNLYKYSLDYVIYPEDFRDVFELEKGIFQVINDNGGIYMSDFPVRRDESSEYNAYTQTYTPFIIVNKQYLRGYDIKLEDGKELNLDLIDTNTLLIPKNRKHVVLSKYNQFTKGKNLDVINIKEGSKYYNPNIYSRYPSKLFEDPIILLMEEYIENSGVIYPDMYFSDIRSMENALDNNGFKGKYGTINVDALTENVVNNNIQILTKGITAIIVYTFILLIFLYQSVYLYMEETKRLISVQYVLGHGKMRRYSEIIVMNLAPHAFLFMISILFLSIPTKLIFTFCTTFMIIEFLFMVYMIKKFERNTVIVVLKGE